MRIPLWTHLWVGALTLTLVLACPGKAADTPYFAGKTITMIVSWDPGGRIDRQARTVAKFLSKYVPGSPNFVILNIPGGSGIPANVKFNASKPDGTTLMMQTSRDLESAIFELPGATYDPLKYVWIGSVSTGSQRNVLYTHKRTGFESLEDLKSKEVVLGSPRVGHRAYLYGRLMGEILGLKIRWVLGYSSPEMDVAVERGEIDGRVNDASTIQSRRPDWIEKGLIVPHMAMTVPEQLPPLDHPLFAKVPSIMDFAKTDVQREIIKKINTTDRLSASLTLPPGTPDQIRAILEKALLKVGSDPEFQKEWETFVLSGTRFGGVFSTEEVVEAMQVYGVWKPEVLKHYRKLAFEAP